MNKIQLGDKAKDTVTGFEGIVVGRTEWLNGCSRLGMTSDKLKDGLPTETQWFDEPQLKLVKSGVVQCGPRNTGGPIPTPKRNTDPSR